MEGIREYLFDLYHQLVLVLNRLDWEYTGSDLRTINILEDEVVRLKEEIDQIGHYNPGIH